MTTQQIKTENIKETDFSMETTIITLDGVPTISEQYILFGNDDSIVLEF
jgi:hypothetical protein